MTPLDKVFIKAYSRPRRGSAVAPAGQAAPLAGVPLVLGSGVHRLDPPSPIDIDRPRIADDFGPAPRQTALPSQHAESVSPVGIPAALTAPEPPAPAVRNDAAVKMSVAATATDLGKAWPARFLADTPALLDDRPAAPAGARPLSAFATAPRAVGRVRPLLEVDRFIWPAECAALCAAAEGALDGFVSLLSSGAAEGRHRVALLGVQPTVGRKTIALSLVRRAAARGGNWVLVDADFAQPGLAARLGILEPAGWSRVLTGQQELGEVLIASVEDRFCLAPLEPAAVLAEQLSTNFRVPVLFDMLAEAFDVVLLDVGAPGPSGIESLAAFSQAARLDAVFVVYDARTTDTAALTAYARRVSDAGICVAGTIANFAPPAGESA